ncbi:hypothetical protein XENOCAPTIV_021894, partial [Xenoophorus captivus]
AAENAAVLLQKNGRKEMLVDSVETDSLSVLMKTVNQLSAATPLSQVMLLAHQEDSGKILCACQVPKVTLLISQGHYWNSVSDWLSSSSTGFARPRSI